MMSRMSLKLTCHHLALTDAPRGPFLHLCGCWSWIGINISEWTFALH